MIVRQVLAEVAQRTVGPLRYVGRHTGFSAQVYPARVLGPQRILDYLEGRAVPAQPAGMDDRVYLWRRDHRPIGPATISNAPYRD